MGKVRKLRKKYKVLCRRNATISKTSNLKKTLKNATMPEKKNASQFDNSSTALIPETMNESTRRKPQHLSNSIRPLNRVRLSESTAEVLKLGDNLPVIKKHVGRKNNGNIRMKMKRKTDHSRKQISKIHQNNFVQEIYVFKKTLNEESFHKNPRTMVMNQTLERLSTECSFHSKK